MPRCKKCGESFPSTIRINKKRKYLHNRKYCLECNPLGERKFWREKEVDKTDYIDGKRILKKREFVCIVCGKKRNQKTRNNKCSTCSTLERKNKNRKKATDILGGKCIICGYKRCSEALDFHHKNSKEKEFMISRIWSHGWLKIEKEIKKCVLLCSNCHREYHAGLVKEKW